MDIGGEQWLLDTVKYILTGMPIFFVIMLGRSVFRRYKQYRAAAKTMQIGLINNEQGEQKNENESELESLEEPGLNRQDFESQIIGLLFDPEVMNEQLLRIAASNQWDLLLVRIISEDENPMTEDFGRKLIAKETENLFILFIRWLRLVCPKLNVHIDSVENCSFTVYLRQEQNMDEIKET